ncbi:hypothetical protein Y032_0026g1303 [Ancylostoma ceylanicum]|uniref:Uncharacterized protein n=1 Tax=Ancylostoma ceylanicum TaxID=53326 RepID=A0A016UUM7_9BILA|nr:hypothetical protein Y032_0026g1303 [Ancylostoma ceylanicum]
MSDSMQLPLMTSRKRKLKGRKEKLYGKYGDPSSQVTDQCPSLWCNYIEGCFNFTNAPEKQNAKYPPTLID